MHLLNTCIFGRDELDFALKIYGGKASYAAENAHAAFKLARVLSLLGEQEEALRFRQEADCLLAEIGKTRGCKLTEADIDSLLAFWSK